MYLNFYQLKSEPFHITPDPAFLYLSPSHREAMAAIMYGVEQRKGFVLVTGEVGTGKTTVVRSYLEQRNKAKAQEDGSALVPIYLFNADITFDELINTILKGLKIDAAGKPLGEKIRKLHWGLIDAYRAGRNIALFVDEAQNMPVDTLEKLRMLSNLETHNEKLIQIILIGQPELLEKLQRHELRQLRQRIVIKARIDKLSPKESEEYIRHRLSCAALLQTPVFSGGAIRRIARASNGYPRAMNVICENAMLLGFGMQQRPISSATAQRAIRDWDGKAKPPARAWRRPVQALAAAALILVGVLAGVAWKSLSGEESMPTARAAAPDNSVESPAQSEPEPMLDGPAEAEPVTEPVEESKIELEPVEPTKTVEEVPQEDALTADAIMDGLAVFGRANPPKVEEVEEPAAVVEAPAEPEVWIVSAGDSLIKIAIEAYGNASPSTMAAIRENNPRIQHDDHIEIGQRIVLPLIESTASSR